MTAYEEAARRIPVGEGAQVIVAGGGADARFMLDLQGEPWAVPVGKLQEALRETGLAMHADELGK